MKWFCVKYRSSIHVCTDKIVHQLVIVVFKKRFVINIFRRYNVATKGKQEQIY